MAVLSLVLGCQGQEVVPSVAAPPALPTATPAAALRPDAEVLIATRPDGASALFRGARVGQTPLKLIVREPIPVVLEKPGYVTQTVLVGPESGPNLVITLMPESLDRRAPATATKPATAAKPAARKAGPREPEAPAETRSEPAGYDTMRQIKDALRRRQITESQYRTFQSDIRRRRAADLDAAEKAYRRGQLSRDAYRLRVRAIRLKYEG